jgi:hypothetical protein
MPETDNIGFASPHQYMQAVKSTATLLLPYHCRYILI